MPNNFEFRDSVSTGDVLRYINGTYFNIGAGGRGGRLAFDTNGLIQKWSVSPEASKVAAAAWNFFGAVSGFAYAMIFYEGSTVHVKLLQNSVGKLEVYRDTTLLATSTNQLFFPGDIPHIEAKVTIGDSGSVEVRVNETDVTFTSSLASVDTKNGGSGVIDIIGTGVVGGHCWIHDVNSQFAGSDWAGDVAVLYSPAASAGTYTDGTPNGAATNLQCVDEVYSTGDVDYISQDDTGLPKAVSFGITALPANVTAVLDVLPICLSRKDDAGTDLVRGLLISGATEDDGGADVGVISSYANVFGTGAGARHYQTDPNTSAAWTISNVNAIEVGRRRVA